MFPLPFCQNYATTKTPQEARDIAKEQPIQNVQ